MSFPGSRFFMNTVLLILLAITICSGCSSKKKANEEPQKDEIDLLALVSVQVQGWQEEKSTLMTEESKISEYSGKEADVYFAYGLRRLAVKRYKNDRSLPIRLEIYEFKGSENAYGAFSFDAVGKDEYKDIGQDAVYEYGLLEFWKDTMLVKVIAEEDFIELEKDVIAFGREVDSNIRTTGQKPDLIDLIPEENRLPGSRIFFYRDISLNIIYRVEESTDLRLSDQTRAVTAAYAMGGSQPTRLVLIEYPGESEARLAFDDFGESYFQGIEVSASLSINVMQLGEDEYSSISLKGKFIILVFDARHSNVCLKLVRETITKIEMH